MFKYLVTLTLDGVEFDIRVCEEDEASARIAAFTWASDHLVGFDGYVSEVRSIGNANAR